MTMQPDCGSEPPITYQLCDLEHPFVFPSPETEGVGHGP